MSYISHEDYKAMMAKFQANSPKGMLKESVEEGNAFTAGLAKAKKGQEFKVGGKKVKDTSNYDAKLEGYADNYPGSWGYREGLEEAGTGDAPISKMSRKDMIEFLGTTEEKAKDMSDDELRDAVAEKNEDMKEGLHMPPLQATGQTIDTVEENSIIDAPFGVANRGTKTQLEGPGLQLSNLTVDERKQLGEFVEAVKTTKGAIEKLLEKASGKKVKVKETMGGNHSSGLVMTPSTVSEDMEGMVSPKYHTMFQKLIKALKAEGLDDADIEMFIKYEMEQIGKEAVAGQYDLEEKSYKVSKNSVPAHTLKAGDIITSGEEVVSVSAGAKTPGGKVDVVLKNLSTGKERGAQWGKHTMIGKKPKAE